MDPFAPYLPMDRRQALVQNATLPPKAMGAALFADLSGFTPLTKQLALELGPLRGAEAMTDNLNRIYGPLIAEVHRFQGSVISFSGDAITCWFSGGDTFGSAEAAKSAVACAFAIQRVMGEVGTTTTPGGEKLTMAVKVAVVAGAGQRFLVGDPDIQLIEVLAGYVVTRMALAEQVLSSGEIALGSELLGYFGPDLTVKEWRRSTEAEYFAVVDGRPDPTERPWPKIKEQTDERLRQWMLPPLLERVQQGAYMAQLRACVPLFLKFSGLDYEVDETAADKLDSYIRWVQGILESYGGHLLQLTLGDKGSYLYAIFGGLLAYEDNVNRAVTAALALSQPPSYLDYITATQIGLSQGQMYTGTYGGPMRLTYGVLGNEVNVAARLMAKAKAGQVVVSPRITTMLDAEQYQSIGHFPLKGLPEPVELFELRSQQQRPTNPTFSRTARKGTMIGRQAELRLLNERLASLRDGRSSIVIIEGEAGIGKSRLTAELLSAAEEKSVQRLVGQANGMEKNKPYHAWQPVFSQLLGWYEFTEEPMPVRRERIIGRIPPDQRELAPLLGGVLPLDWPDNAFTASLHGDGRANKTNDLLLGLLKQVVIERPLLLILEDLHWFDSASWSLARLASLDVQPLLMVLVTRPLPDPLPSEYRYFQARQQQSIKLESMPPADIVQLVSSRLGVEELPLEMARLIQQRADGHPFFSEELAYALRDTGLITIEDGRCSVAANVNLETAVLPDTIQGIIASRLDMLDTQQQLTIKVASVIGRVFAIDLLGEVYPQKTDEAEILESIEQTTRLDITLLETPRPDLCYIFKHAITQEVTYNSLLFAQRRTLHQAIAEWYEKLEQDNLTSFYPLLAHHWQHAERPQKAVFYLDKAADTALNEGAYKEAIVYLDHLLKLVDQLPTPPERIQQAEWFFQIGRAYYSIGQPIESTRYLAEALEMLGRPLPKTKLQLGLGFLRSNIRNLTSICRYALTGRHTAEKEIEPAVLHQRKLQHSIYSFLSRISWFSGDKDLMGYTGGWTCASAWSLGNHDLEFQAKTFGDFSIGIGLYGQKWLSIQYRRLAEELVEKSASPGMTSLALYHMDNANWSQANQMLTSVIEAMEKKGSLRDWEEATSMVGSIHYYQGQYQESLAVLAECERVARRQEDDEFLAWAFLRQASCLLCMGRYAEARPLLDEAQGLFEGVNVPVGWFTAVGYRLQLYARRADDLPQSGELLEQALKYAREAAVTSSFSFQGHLGLAQYSLAAMQRHTGTQTIQQAKEACRLALDFSQSFPRTRPYAHLCQGRFEALTGQKTKAEKQYRQALQLARDTHQPYEEGLAHYYLAELFAEEPSKRQAHLGEFEAIFARIGAGTDLTAD